MIDPLVDQPKPIDPVGKSLVAVAEALTGTVVSAARYLTADMELFARDDVFSRFQLVPFRPEPGKVGEAALAGASLYGAAGWCARPFRVHDFLLGRWNMKEYLQRQLVLAGNNHLFDAWSLDDRKDWARDAAGERLNIDESTEPATYFLPILPVLPTIVAYRV
ncbi:MAG: hypothetical protein ABSC06_39705 [Rhodopila sp.]|jgi:hypothetical protein